MKFYFALVITFSLFSISTNAKNYRHLIEGAFELSSLKFDNNRGSSSSFDINVNYWHKYSRKLYLVGNFEFIDDDLRGDGHLFAGGAAYNMADNTGGDFEIGPGFRFGLISLGDESGFLFGPYLFVRNYFRGTRAFINFELSYNFAFMDDTDFRGFVSTVALGIAF